MHLGLVNDLAVDMVTVIVSGHMAEERGCGLAEEHECGRMGEPEEVQSAVEEGEEVSDQQSKRVVGHVHKTVPDRADGEEAGAAIGEAVGEVVDIQAMEGEVQEMVQEEDST